MSQQDVAKILQTASPNISMVVGRPVLQVFTYGLSCTFHMGICTSRFHILSFLEFLWIHEATSSGCNRVTLTSFPGNRRFLSLVSPKSNKCRNSSESSEFQWTPVILNFLHFFRTYFCAHVYTFFDNVYAWFQPLLAQMVKSENRYCQNVKLES